MNLLFYFLTGLVQGLTEFLPVSSSGHLVLFQHLYGKSEMQENHLINVMVHLGTMIAIIIVFRKKIAGLIIDFFRIPSMIKKNGLKYTMSYHSVRFIFAVIIGSVPAFFVGYFLHDQITNMNSILVVGFMFLITASLLFVSKLLDDKDINNNTNNNEYDTKQSKVLTILKGFIIGIAQAVAILPGISRSGSTIVTGRFLGLDRDTASSFSFIMSLPAIFGASVLELSKAAKMEFANINLVGIFIGFTVSLVVGWLSLTFLISFIKKGRLYYFGFYLTFISAVCLISYFVI